MTSAAAFPVPASTEAALVWLALAFSVALPFYLLVLRPVRGETVWGLSEIIGVSVIFLLTLPLAALSTGLVGIGADLTLAGLSIITIVQNAFFVGLSLYVARVRYGLGPGYLGLRFDAWRSGVVLGIGAAAVTVPLALAGERLALFLLGLVTGPEAAAARVAAEHLSDPLRPIIESMSDITSARWLVFLLAVVVPMGEEVFFRGFVYGGLRARWGIVIGVLASAVFFSVVHMQLVHGVPIFILGVLFAVLYERTGSLLPAMVAHGLNNVLAVMSIWRGWDL